MSALGQEPTSTTLTKSLLERRGALVLANWNVALTIPGIVLSVGLTCIGGSGFPSRAHSVGHRFKSSETHRAGTGPKDSC
jgi:hypothetical protein